jgi:metal-responsive CopG/Arc/MetJ family transcriptional regulator
MYVHYGQGSMEEKTERFEMRVPGSFLAAIDAWRRTQEDLPSRAEAIRRLVEQALSKPKK